MPVAAPRLVSPLLLAAALATPARAARTATREDAELASGSVSLHTAVGFALSHQPEVLAARERLRAVRAELDVPAAQWRPFIGAVAELEGGSTNNSTASVVSSRALDLPRIGATSVPRDPSWQPYPSSLVALGVRQELFDFGRIAAQTAAAEGLAAIDKERLRGARLDAVLAVTEAYYAVLAAHSVLQVATEAVDRARVHREYADAAVHSGLRAAIELTRAQADVTRFEVNRIRADGNLRVAKSVFAAAVGYAGPELDALAEPDPSWTLPARGDVQARARDADPLVRESVSQARAQRLQTAALSTNDRPNVFVTAAVSGRAGGAPASNGLTTSGRGWLPEVPNYSAAVILEWPLLDPVNRARARASQRHEDAFLAQVDVVRQQATTRAEQAYRNAEAALQALAALERATEAARANHEQAEARFKTGLGTSTELADAEMLRIDAEIQLAIGKFQIAVERAKLARVMTEEP